MSHYMTALAMRQTGLKPAAKVVLYWLADHHNSETGRCFPSLNTLARECEMARNTVVRHLAGLEAAGLISRTQQARENGSQTSTSYALHLEPAPVPKQNSPCSKTEQAPVPKCTPHNLGRYNLGTEQEEYTDADAPDATSDDVIQAVDAYNDAAARAAAWPKVQRVTPARRKAVLARLREVGGLDGWRSALEKAEQSDFLSGQSGRWQGFSFDWLSKQSNMTKVLEGNYDNKPTRECRLSSADDRSARSLAFAARAVRTPSQDCF